VQGKREREREGRKKEKERERQRKESATRRDTFNYCRINNKAYSHSITVFMDKKFLSVIFYIRAISALNK